MRVLWLILLVFTSYVHADVRRVWENKPLTIVLPVNQEVRVIFPTDVDIQVPMGISEKLHSLAPDLRMIYWTANDSFESARIIATATDGKTVYILDVAANESGISEDIFIEDPVRKSIVIEESSSSVASESLESMEQPLEDPSEIILTRFASQTLYAPRRLIPIDTRISPVTPVKLNPNFPLLQSMSGEQFSIKIVGAWAGFNQYVTAVLIINKSLLSFQLDLSRVRGNFTHITAQHLLIGPSGSLEDRTTIYLISTQPFNAALLEDSYAY